MATVLYVWINKKRYMLCSYNDVTWRLFNYMDRIRLNLAAAHTLDFWRRKGVLNGEEEKKDKGS